MIPALLFFFSTAALFISHYAYAVKVLRGSMKGKKFLVEIRTISFQPVVKAEMNFRNLCYGTKMTIIADEMQNTSSVEIFCAQL